MPMLTPTPAASSEPALLPSHPGGSASSGAEAAPGFAQALQRHTVQQHGSARDVSGGDRAAAAAAGQPPAATRSAPAQAYGPHGPHAPLRGAARCGTAGHAQPAGLALLPADARRAAAEATAPRADGRAAAPATDEHDDAAHDAGAPVLPDLLAWMANLALPGPGAPMTPEPARAAAEAPAAADTAADTTADITAVAGAAPPHAQAAAAALAAASTTADTQGGAAEAAAAGQASAGPRGHTLAAGAATARGGSAAARHDERAAAPDGAAASAPARPQREDTPAPAAAWLAQAGAAPQEPPVQEAAAPGGAAAAPMAGAIAAPARPALPHAAAPLQSELRERVGSEPFAPALASRLAVFVRDGIEHAQLRLNPAEMGPIDVRIRLDGTQAQVDFSAAHAQTRQTLQEAVPLLAGALREAGLTLAGGGVFEQPRDAQSQQRHDAPPRTDGGQGRTGTAAPAAPAAAAHPARARGAVDLYA